MEGALPVEACIEDVRAALAGAGHAVLVAPPGAGKTTIVPLRLLDEPWLLGRIVLLEPRRLAARAAARRMAALLGEPVGATVGYRTRTEQRVSAATRVEVVTEGILTRRLQHDPALPGVALLVFDELHERSIHADLGLALALDARADLRPDLRILAMSATLDAARVAALLGGEAEPAPVVESAGRAHPVEVRWRPPRRGQRTAEAVAEAVTAALAEEHGDVLAFLPGAGDIRRAAELLSGALDGVDVRPLFGALAADEQDAALAASPPGRRRVVLATDIAETSLTVEGVRVVVDAGLARVPRRDDRRGLTRLTTVTAAKSSAEQRAGRAGRLGPGVAYRLWSKVEHAARPPRAEPEIRTADLAPLALELAVWGDPTGTGLAFLDPPPRRSLDAARLLLTELGALDAGGRPTTVGEAMAALPLHPRLARMVVGAYPGDGWLACCLAALLEDRDVLRGHPDQLPVDLAVRVQLLEDLSARHPALDVAALRAARQRARDIAGRMGAVQSPVDLARVGPVLRLAYPDRVGDARGRGRFRIGTGAWVPADDPLAAAPAVVVADLDAGRRDARIRLAAALPDVG